MTDSQRIDALEVKVAQLQKAVDGFMGVTGNVLARRLVMSWPCGDITRRQLAPWWSAVGYGEVYRGGQIHTGHDLNLAGFADSGQPVFAVADGIIRYAGRVDAAWLSVVVTEHVDEGRVFWVRYAHVTPLPSLVIGSTVMRGTMLANIADYGKAGREEDHLHLDGAWKDLGNFPNDWPGKSKARVDTDYFDLIKMIGERLP